MSLGYGISKIINYRHKVRRTRAQQVATYKDPIVENNRRIERLNYEIKVASGLGIFETSIAASQLALSAKLFYLASNKSKTYGQYALCNGAATLGLCVNVVGYGSMAYTSYKTALEYRRRRDLRKLKVLPLQEELRRCPIDKMDGRCPKGACTCYITLFIPSAVVTTPSCPDLS